MRRFSSWLTLLMLASVAQSLVASSYVVPPDKILIDKAEAIVVARVSSVWVEDSTEQGIQTITEFVVDNPVKGSIEHRFTVRMPGGVFGKYARVVGGVPRFVVGDQELLFVNHAGDDGTYWTTDLALGRFALKYDDVGRHLALRQEVYGWDLNTLAPHRERARLAEKFIDYIKAVAQGEVADPDYFIDATDDSVRVKSTGALHPIAQSCTFGVDCSPTGYTLTFDGTEGGPGGRWTTFPSAVNWNRGSSEAGLTNGGSDAINNAFNAWNSDTGSNVNYVLATTTANSSGSNDLHDGVNNIVFDKTNIGTAFTCSGGGLLGLGGVTLASGSNMLAGETFFSNVEGDVSMNQGVAPCIGVVPGITLADFTSSITHEVGHTLGFRHSDKTRVNTAACTTISTYDCSSNAIMTAILVNGLNFTLQTWDQHAVESLYPAPAGPAALTNVVAVATSGTTVHVTWTGSCQTTCKIMRSSNRTTFTQANGGTVTGVTSYDDMGATANTAYLYKVLANNGADSADSNLDLATTVTFTNDPLVAATTTIQAVHLTELRTAVNAVRKLANNGVANDFPFTDSTITGGTTTVKAVHVTDLRTALDAAMMTLGFTVGGYTNGSLSGATIHAIDFQEIRNRVK